MRLPIQLALAWPERLAAGVEPVPLTERPLTFEPIDREAFPAVDLAYRVGGLGLTFPAVMNAANEVAVMAFLEGKIPLTRIVEIVQSVVDEHEPASVVSVVNIERADAWARAARRRDHRGALSAWGSLASSSCSSAASSYFIMIIISHELAHYLTARAFGFRVLEYFVGFGPRLVVVPTRRDRVRREGAAAGRLREDRRDEPLRATSPEDQHRAYGAKPIWQRALVILAGPVSHFRRGRDLFAVGCSSSATRTSSQTVVVVGGRDDAERAESPASAGRARARGPDRAGRRHRATHATTS